MTAEDWRSRARWWEYGRIAVEVFTSLPFWTMSTDDGLVRQGDYCFAARGQIYVVYVAIPPLSTAK
jgi:hypothetical protein